uniref:Uncharacterized protein n=1 Tax=Anguilla anguilla TaxID=7936 RepID=A0A0E9WRI1_ANGAN
MMITFYNCIRTEHKHGNIFCCKQHQASAHALHTRLSLSLSLSHKHKSSIPLHSFRDKNSSIHDIPICFIFSPLFFRETQCGKRTTCSK